MSRRDTSQTTPLTILFTRRRLLTLAAGASLSLFAAACQQAPAPAPKPADSKPAAPAAAAPTSAPAQAAPAQKPVEPAKPAADAKPAAAAAPAGGTPKPGGIWKTVAVGEAPHFDMLQYQGPGQEAFHVCYSSLVTTDQLYKNGKEWAPDLAETWKLSDDKLTWTFNLRKGVKWHDGAPFTSADVKYSLDRARKPPQGTINPNSSLFAPIEEITTPDDYTVVVKTSAPYVALLDALDFPVHKIQPKHIIERDGDMKKTVIGTGPFKWKEWVPGSHYELVKNPDYFRPGRPYVDGFKVQIIPDDDARFNAFRTHDAMHVISYADININQLKVIEQTLPKVKVQALKPTGLTAIFFNLDKEPWSDIRVRKAISIAIDRQAYIDTIGQGRDMYGGLVPPGTEYSNPEDVEAVKKLPGWRRPKDQDIAEAKKLLAEAGFPNGFQTTMLTRNISKTVAQAQWGKDQLAKIGIQVDLSVVEDATALAQINQGKYEIISGSMNTALGQPEGYIGAMMRRDLAKWPKWRAANPQLDELASKVEKLGTVEERRKAVLDLQNAVLDLVPHVIGVWQFKYNVLWEDLRGWSGDPGIQLYTNYWDVWLDR